MESQECKPRPEMRKGVRETVSKADMQVIKLEGSMSVTRSSAGPGGQNVNKNAKTAEFRWTPADSSTFNEAERMRIIEWMRENKPSQFVGEGEIYITSTKNKNLDGNKKEVLKILHSYLTEAFKPQIERRTTKPTRGSVIRRLDDKTRRGRTKELRGKVTDW